jgi:plasmid stabilization system protein ParE
MGRLGFGTNMKPAILKLARDDLKGIHEHLSEFGANPPKRFRANFEKFCVQVSNAPYIYSRYMHNPKYRRAVIEYDYLVFYQVEERTGRAEVFRVLHGKRDIMPLLNDD